MVIFRHWLLAIQDLHRRENVRLDLLPPADLHDSRIDPERDVGHAADARSNVRTGLLRYRHFADGDIFPGDEQHPVRRTCVETRHSILIVPLEL